MPEIDPTDDALLARLDAAHDPDQLDEWGDPMPHVLCTEAAARIRAQTARIAKLEALMNDLEVNIREALAALTPASGVANDR